MVARNFHEHPSPSRPFTIWHAVALSALFVLGALLMLQLAVLVAGAHGQGGSGSMLLERSRDPMNILLAQLAGTLLSLGVGLAWLQGSNPMASLGLDRIPAAASVGWSVLAGVCLQFPLTELANILQYWLPVSLEDQLAMQQFLNPDHWLRALLTTTAVVMIAPLGEEIIFRGLIFQGLHRHYHRILAIALSSVLFGIAHLGWMESIYASLVGVLFCIALLRTGSLWVCIIMHASFNAVPLLLSSRLIPIRGFNTISAEVEHLRTDLLVISTVLFIAAYAALCSKRTSR